MEKFKKGNKVRVDERIKGANNAFAIVELISILQFVFSKKSS